MMIRSNNSPIGNSAQEQAYGAIALGRFNDLLEIFEACYTVKWSDIAEYLAKLIMINADKFSIAYKILSYDKPLRELTKKQNYALAAEIISHREVYTEALRVFLTDISDEYVKKISNEVSQKQEIAKVNLAIMESANKAKAEKKLQKNKEKEERIAAKEAERMAKKEQKEKVRAMKYSPLELKIRDEKNLKQKLRRAAIKEKKQLAEKAEALRVAKAEAKLAKKLQTQKSANKAKIAAKNQKGAANRAGIEYKLVKEFKSQVKKIAYADRFDYYDNLAISILENFKHIESHILAKSLINKTTPIEDIQTVDRIKSFSSRYRISFQAEILEKFDIVWLAEHIATGDYKNTRLYKKIDWATRVLVLKYLGYSKLKYIDGPNAIWIFQNRNDAFKKLVSIIQGYDDYEYINEKITIAKNIDYFTENGIYKKGQLVFKEKSDRHIDIEDSRLSILTKIEFEALYGNIEKYPDAKIQ